MVDASMLDERFNFFMMHHKMWNIVNFPGKFVYDIENSDYNVFIRRSLKLILLDISNIIVIENSIKIAEM